MDDVIKRTEFRETVDGLYRQIESSAEKVSRHAKANYTQADRELAERISRHDVVLFGDGSSPGLRTQVAVMGNTMMSLESSAEKLRESVDSLRYELARGKKGSSSGSMRAVQPEPWHKSPGGQKVLLAIAAVLVAAGGAISGYWAHDDRPPPPPRHAE